MVELSASKLQAALVIGVKCDDTVDSLLRQQKLRRLPGIYCVRITYESLAEYLGLPLPFVAQACEQAAAKIAADSEAASKAQVQFELPLVFPPRPAKESRKPNSHSTWPFAVAAKGKRRKRPSIEPRRDT